MHQLTTTSEATPDENTEDDMKKNEYLDDKKTGLHHKIFPYTEQVIQYANEREGQDPWIVPNRSTATRNERRGYGRAMTRVWTPGEWTFVTSEETSHEDV